MTVTLDQIKSLRELTGVSTMSCKKALEEAEGDESKAVEILRKKGEAKAAERSDRSTNFGVVAIEIENNKAAMISLGCETDFVAKNEGFIDAVQMMAKKLLVDGENIDLSSEINDLNIKMGEKVELKDKKVISGTNIGHYVHSNKKIAVLVSLNDGNEEMAKDIAMHIAAMNPQFLNPEDITADSAEKEKEIWIEQLKNEGKPDEIIGKILLGKEKKFREESALMTQNFIKDPEKTIKDVLGNIAIDTYLRFTA